jgi:DNA-binding transcriptional MocR family regulator
MFPGNHLSAAQLARLLGDWQGSGRGPRYLALSTALRQLLLDGRLPLGARVPSERELTAVLPVSRSTVAAAYERLREEGFLVSRRGARSWLTLPDRSVGLLPAACDESAELDWTRAAPAAPIGVLHEAMTAAANALTAHLPGPGYELLGLWPLRATIAEGYCRRGLPTEPDQILITNGAQHALSLILRALLTPGDRVLTESPTYPNALLALAQAGARPVSVPVQAAGWDLDLVEATLRQAAPTLAYLIPDYHNPTGALLDEAGRVRLVEALQATRTTAVIDETLVDLRLDGPPMPAPTAALHDGVITLGSMSKSHWGGLRIGWIRAQPNLVTQIAEVRPGADLGTPVLEQLAAAHLLHNPDRVLPAARGAARERRDALVDLLTQVLPEMKSTLPHGGLSLWVELPFSATALAQAADRERLHLSPGTRFGTAAELDRWLRLPYTLPVDALRAAVLRLQAIARTMPDTATLPRPATTV